jgi:hypothetical protein
MTENMPEEEKIIDDKLVELEDNKDYKEIKEKLDKGNNFIDYFLIIGVEPIIYRDFWLFTEELETIKENLKEELKPKIISSFPYFEKTTIAFDESILIHCFPNGYELKKSKLKPKQKIFSFILDNNYYNLNYPQKYLTCLICYESIVDYKILSELENNPDLDIRNIDRKKIASSIKEPDIWIPKCLLIMSLYPYFGEFEKIITEIYNYSLNLVFQPLDKIEQFSKLSENAKKNHRRISFRRMSTVAEVLKNKDVNEPVDKIIENLLIELPVPPRGVTTMKYFLNEEERTIKQNEMNQLPLLDVNLKRIFTDFEVKDIITIYNYIFLESRILFFSKNIEILNNYIYGLLALLYPFQYQYQVVTILPKINFEIIESITPFIAGINMTYENDFFEKNNYQLSDCILVVDIDRGKCNIINQSEENMVPDFPYKYRKNLEKKLQEIINKYLKKKNTNRNARKSKFFNINAIDTKKEGLSPTSTFSISTNNETIDSNKSAILQKDMLNSIIEESNLFENDIFNMTTYNINMNDDEEDLSELLNNLNIDYTFNQEIADLFFDFNANLLSNYNQFLNRDFYSLNTLPCLEILFKVPEYLKTIPLSDKKFYVKFITETQIFGDFLYLRMIPKNSKEKIRILKFDEKINENSSYSRYSKANSAVFTTTKEYEFVKAHAIQKPRVLTEKEIEFYKNKKNQKKLLTYGVVVTEDKINDKIIIFNYPIFPKLTISFFLADNIKDYFPPNNWSEDIDLINEDIISKSHLGDVSIRLDDMKKYIYLCWMQMWAITFWYCEENEKRYRFQELIRVIELSSCYEMEIFNLLFETLSVYGKDYMILKLYDVLLKKKLNPSLKAHNIVLKLIESKKVEGNFSDNLKKIIEKEEKNHYTKNKFSRRTFRSKYYPNILTEHIKFYAFDSCIICQKDVNLELISKNLKEMNRDLIWAKCPNPECKEPLLPKLTIQFGEEINKTGEMRNNTCNYETVVLFSPYILKNNYNTSFSFSKIGIKLDVDEFMMKYSTIFWDSLWYFKLNDLEYDFMQPYYYRLAPIMQDPKFNIILVENEKNNGEDNGEESSLFDVNKFQICNFSFTI